MDKFCRVCARSNGFQSFDLPMVSQITKVRIYDMLIYCTQQEVSTEDSFPQQICAECFATLNSAFLFRKLTYQSAASFQENLTNSVSVLESIQDQEVAIPLAAEVIIKEEQMDSIEEELVEPSGSYPEETTDLHDANESSENEASVQVKVLMKKTRYKRGTTLTYMCKECHYSSQNSHNFKRHQKSYNHSSFTQVWSKPIKRFSEVLPDPSTAPMQCELTTIQKTRLYRCTACGFQTFVLPNFKRHQTIKKHSSQNLYTKPFSESVLARLQKCPACGDLFASVAQLARHMKKAISNHHQAISDGNSHNVAGDAVLVTDQDQKMEVLSKDTEIKSEIEVEQKDLCGDS